MLEQFIYQFKITLLGITPSIWRRIQVPAFYNFWDLHVAIQNSMGWLDCQAHEFIARDPLTGKKRSIGIPEDDNFYNTTSMGWKVKIRRYVKANRKIRYFYDFVDGWEHELRFEGERPELKNIKYPLCLDGSRACPPESIGGIPGYENFLKIIKNSNASEYQEMLNWVGGSFDAEDFDPKRVVFQDPKKHLELALQLDIKSREENKKINQSLETQQDFLEKNMTVMLY